MAQFGGITANMGPFAPVSLKGNAFVHGVPMFVDKLPLTLGGIAGEDVKNTKSRNSHCTTCKVIVAAIFNLTWVDRHDCWVKH